MTSGEEGTAVFLRCTGSLRGKITVTSGPCFNLESLLQPIGFSEGESAQKQELETTGLECDLRFRTGAKPMPVKQRKDRKNNVVHRPLLARSVRCGGSHERSLLPFYTTDHKEAMTLLALIPDFPPSHRMKTGKCLSA